MASDLEELRHQSEEHPLVATTDFQSLDGYVLYLIHRVAYEQAAARAAGKDVLEIGCNNGYGTVIVAAQSRSTIGVDVSPAAIESAQRNNARPNIQYRTIDGLRLPFEDAQFDLVISFQVIEHISDVGRYLSEMRRVLRPGGIALLTTPNATIRLNPGMKPWNEFHVHEYTADEVRALLEQHFDSVEIRGLFATPVLYDIERQRVEAAKNRAIQRRMQERTAAHKVREATRRAVKAIVPKGIMRALRGTPSTSTQQTTAMASLDEETLRRYSTADFFYRTDSLDDALDFLAVCAKR